MQYAYAFFAILAVGGIVTFLLRRRSSGDDPETFVFNEFHAMIEDQGGEPNIEYLYVEIPDSVGPIERGEKYEDPIEDVLSENSLGEVTGGGTMLATDKSIKYVGLDVTVYDLDKSLPIIAAELRKIGAPKGTVIHFSEEGSTPFDIWENENK